MADDTFALQYVLIIPVMLLGVLARVMDKTMSVHRYRKVCNLMRIHWRCVSDVLIRHESVITRLGL